MVSVVHSYPSISTPPPIPPSVFLCHHHTRTSPATTSNTGASTEYLPHTPFYFHDKGSYHQIPKGNLATPNYTILIFLSQNPLLGLLPVSTRSQITTPDYFKNFTVVILYVKILILIHPSSPLYYLLPNRFAFFISESTLNHNYLHVLSI